MIRVILLIARSEIRVILLVARSEIRVILLIRSQISTIRLFRYPLKRHFPKRGGFPLKAGHQMEYPVPNTTIQCPIPLSSIQYSVSTEVRLLFTDYCLLISDVWLLFIDQ